MKYYTSILLLFLVFSQTTTAQNCSNMVGKWKNELGAILYIQKIDESSGSITGKLKPPRSLHYHNKYPSEVIGYVGNYKKSIRHKPLQSAVTSIAVTIKWPDENISSFNGICNTNSQGVPAIKFLTLKSLPVVNIGNEHNQAGASTYLPVKS